MVHDHQLVAHIERGQQVGLLENDGAGTVHVHGPGVWSDEAGGYGQQRGLAGPGLTHDGGKGVGFGDEGGVGKRGGRGLTVLVGHGGVADIKNGGHVKHFLQEHRVGWL